MSTLFDKMNLRPGERRFVVVAGVVVFIVINIWFVWPHFSDWQNIKTKQAQVQRTLNTYQEEIARIPGYQAKLTKLQATGSQILNEELQLQRIVESQARSNGVFITRFDPRAKGGGGRTNQFFEDQLLTIDCTTGPKELVSFLVNLAAGNSMIRVREMNLKPDASQTKLLATITFVASYQKKEPPKAIAPTFTAAAAIPAKKTNVSAAPKTTPTTPPRIGAGATNRVSNPKSTAVTNAPVRKK